MVGEKKSHIPDTDFLRLVRSRRSVRRYAGRLVEREKILSCIEAARLAPSAENVQPWRFIVLDDRQKIRDFSQEAFSGIYRFTRWAGKAPLLIAICAELDWLANRLGKEIQGTHYYLLDIGIAGEHLVLQALELGLGSCWIGWFHARKAKKVLGVPRSWKVVSLLALGYPAEKKKEKEKKKKAKTENQKLKKQKKNMAEILFFNGYKKDS
jgi:nitroreductase